jgi:regulator of protease activity HflC (stomatin/prohibitin superfamily)
MKMSFTITKQIRAERRARAEERQAEYDKLTLQQKIERLPPEPAAKKQRARLLAKLQKQQEKAAQVQAEAETKKAVAEEKSQKRAKKEKS